MKSLKKINMDKLIFVCYQHGFGGENLSHRISNHALCDNLLVKIEKGRTIIKNDVFNKIFLGFNNNFQYSFQNQEKLCKKVMKNFKNKIDKIKKYNIVPSHIDAGTLRKVFTNSYIIFFQIIFIKIIIYLYHKIKYFYLITSFTFMECFIY